MADSVEIVRLETASGRPIRKTTRVTLSDGYSVTFVDLLPKSLALAEARRLRDQESAR